MGSDTPNRIKIVEQNPSQSSNMLALAQGHVVPRTPRRDAEAPFLPQPNSAGATAILGVRRE